ncbi:hypothetical protein RAS1_27040 [Phycisphaerae bacterium RAS1]|nr:hypothetical protein RAS1_27040 [Phycisphaerae bacterium RAS1]
MTADVMVTILRNLCNTRPVFHSEADVQHALAWGLHEEFRDARVRLEMPLRGENGTEYCDVWVWMGDAPIAVELKYKTGAADLAVAGQRFLLKNQSAQDLGRYDFLKDVTRLERVCHTYARARCYAILLTNDSAYWSAARNETVDAAFRLHDGRPISGRLAWGAAASPGTTRGRDAALHLEGAYRAQWWDYSAHNAGRFALFRYLMLDVTSAMTLNAREVHR